MVTGAAGGIGATYAEALVAQGAAVVLADIDGDGARATAERLGDADTALAVEVDIADDESVNRLARLVTAHFGQTDVLVNNAALHLGQWSHGLDLPLGQWRRILAVNIVGAVACSAAFRPALAERGGSIINQSSSAAYTASAGAYSVSKLGLNGVTMALARELGADGIRVNGIAPGYVSSPRATALVDPGNRDRARTAQHLDRQGDMGDLVGVMLYLASEASRFVTGQTISVDGGTARRP